MHQDPWSNSRWFAIASTVFVLTAAGIWYATTEVLTQIYTATAAMQINPRDIYDVNPLGFPLEQRMYPAYIQAEFEVIQSSDVLLPVINDLGLDKTWAKRYKSGQESLTPEESLAHMQKILSSVLNLGRISWW
ncbi:MAG TPA: Wzz/FepE/Etk N-terminal domain-containing protein [Candidatus Methylacidiphilales bacterium]|nr:Wzz/FepE/Etk N-terminal domain-containing protein [Candidatus Methylacidiphilales bacterium]